nr:MAG TPA: hypothetical protein [Caudoviricetes sp.]
MDCYWKMELIIFLTLIINVICLNISRYYLIRKKR